MTAAGIDSALCRRLAGQLSGKSKRLALLDVDGTLTAEKSVWQFIMTELGCWEPTGRGNLERYLRNEIGYEEFCRLDGALFARIQYSQLVEIASMVPWQPGIDDFFAALQTTGFDIALVSSGLRPLVTHFTERYPILIAAVNDFEISDGICTGNVIIEVPDGQKGQIARNVIDSVQPDFVLSVGDSSGDVPLFALADFSVAVNCSDERARRMATLYLPDGDLSAMGALLVEADQLPHTPQASPLGPGRAFLEAGE